MYRRWLFIAVLLATALASFGIAQGGDCLGNAAHAADCDWDGDTDPNKTDPDDDNDGTPDESDPCKWDDQDTCDDGAPPPPTPDPVAELCALLPPDVSSQLPPCGGGGELPDVEALIAEILAAVCGALPPEVSSVLPVCGGTPPPTPDPNDVLAEFCAGLPPEISSRLPFCTT